jgi:hypothetical protein
MKNTKNKNGGILVMVMVVLLAVSFLTIGFFKLQETDAVEAVHVEQSNQAFWLAEAGLQQTLSKLRSDKDYRENLSSDEGSPDRETDTVGSGSYTVELWGDGSDSNFFVESRGDVRGASRLLRLDAVLGAIGNHGLIGLGKDGSSGSVIRKDCTLNCSIYQNGNLTVSAGTTISGTVYADNYTDFASGAALAEDQVLDMEIDQSAYDTELGLGVTGATITDNILDLAGGTVVVDSSIDNLDGITGGGLLVVKGDQTFNSGLTVDSDITIVVDGTLEFQKDADIGDNVHMYVTGDAKLSKDATVSTGEGCSLLVLGDLIIKKNLDFQGIIFAEGHVTVDKDLKVTGTMIAGEDYTLKKDAVVTFNAGMIPEDVRNDMIIGTHIVQSSMWNELPSN